MTIAPHTAPRIGIPARLSGLGCGSADPRMEAAQKVFDAVVELIRRSGAEPVVIGPGTSEDLDSIFGTCQGFVLPGGGDVDPALFGGPAGDATLFGVDPEQDHLDIATIRYGLENALPVLGICRGLQLLNVVYGGTLHIDLEVGSISHADKEGASGMDFAVHEVELVPGTCCAAVFGDTDRIKIASAHHQAVDILGPGLRVSARSDDGLIEAIESKDEAWVLGIQWHPEAPIPVAELRLPVFSALKVEAERVLLGPADSVPERQKA